LRVRHAARASGAPSDREDSAGFSQHPDEHRSERPVLLAVDQQLGEGAALRVASELSDPVGSLEVGQHQHVEKFGAESGTERVQTIQQWDTTSRPGDSTPERLPPVTGEPFSSGAA